MKNKTYVFMFSFLIAFFASLEISLPTAKAEGAELFEQQKLTSHLLINLFLENIDQNELVIFKQIITRSDLQPHQVSYVHNISDDSLLVRLCFNLKKKIEIPKVENAYVGRITVEVDKNGNIIKVITHVSVEGCSNK